MTKATKTLAIVFAGLVVVTGLVKMMGNTSSTEAFSSDLVEVDTTRVNKVVLDNPTQNRTIKLQNGEKGWRVSDGDSQEEYPADERAVDRALSQLSSLNVKAVATRKPEKYTRFKVDSTGTRVSLYQDDELLSGIIIGAPQFESRREFNNYVRPVEDDAVYIVEGFLGATFNRDLEGWRDKEVWNISEDQINRVDFLFPADSSYSIERVGERKWISEGDTLDMAPVNTMLSRLSRLRANGFVDSLAVDDFGTELYALQLQLEDGSQKRVRLKLPPGEATEYYAVADEFPYLFTVNKSSWDGSVLKSRSALLKK